MLQLVCLLFIMFLYSVSDTYLPDFVLHGTTNKDFGPHLLEDLKAIVRVSILV